MAKLKKDLKPIVILQLSDLHFGMDDSDRTQESAVDSFLESFQNLPEDWKPDILVISGDLANSGDDSEYKRAELFLNKFLSLQEGSKLTKNDIIICPGNHDVNISVQDMQRPTPRCEKDSNLIPLQKDNLAVYLYKFENYINFLKKFGIPCYDNSVLTSDPLTNEKIRYLYGFRQIKGVNFICLNSEWDFNIFKQDSRGNFSIYDKAEGCLRLGAELYKDGISSKNKQQSKDDSENNILITVFHRPISDMHKDEYSAYNNGASNSRKLIISNSHIVLNGHKHVNDDLYDQGNCLFYLCGTFCSKDTKSSEYSYNMFKLAPHHLRGGIAYTCIHRIYRWKYPYSKKPNGIWHYIPEEEEKRIINFSPSVENNILDNLELWIEKEFEERIKGDNSNKKKILKELLNEAKEDLERSEIDSQTIEAFLVELAQRIVDRTKVNEVGNESMENTDNANDKERTRQLGESPQSQDGSSQKNSKN